MCKIAFLPNFKCDGDISNRYISRYGKFLHRLEIVSYDEQFDYLIILNYTNKDLSHIKKDRCIGLTLEPKWSNNYQPKLLQSVCSIVITPFPEDFTSAVFGHSLNCTHIHKNVNDDNYLKTKKLSYILSTQSSNKENLNYSVRKSMLFFLQNNIDIPCDFFGNAVNNYIPDKGLGLYNYEYSIAIENSNYHGYSTEKLIDCLVTLTQPIYYGDPIINKYYSNIPILDVNSPLESIKHTISEKPNIDVLKYNKYLYLTEYNFLKRISNIIHG